MFYRDKYMDHFLANLLLQDTIERIHVGEKYGDIPRGIFLVRGENMVLMGEIVSYVESEVFSKTIWCVSSSYLLA